MSPVNVVQNDGVFAWPQAIVIPPVQVLTVPDGDHYSELFTATGILIVNHSMTARPIVTVLDAANGSVISVGVQHVSATAIHLTFAGTITNGRLILDSASHFEETFTATSTKAVNHALGEQPQVQVLDNEGRQVRVDVDHTDADNLTLTFTGTFTSYEVLCETADIAGEHFEEVPGASPHTIAHNLSNHPHITVTSNGEIIGVDISHTDANNAVLTYGGSPPSMGVICDTQN